MDRRFSVVYCIMLLIQLILAKYCQMWHLVYICIRPAMILCQPTSRPTPLVLFIAFLSGLAVDLLADGVIGLNAAALLPVALLQKPLISLLIDEDVVQRHYHFSFFRHGYIRIGGTLLLVIFLFMLTYALLDNAGERNFGFVMLKTFLSSVVSLIFCIAATAVLSPKQQR